MLNKILSESESDPSTQVNTYLEASWGPLTVPYRWIYIWEDM